MGVASAEIRRIIDHLVQERQRLRADGSESAALNANRLALAYWQLELSRTLAREALSPRIATA
jgi:hypothetical protein